MHADALTEAATTLRLCGQDDEASTLRERAAAIAQRLGYTVALCRVQDPLATQAVTLLTATPETAS